MAEKTKTPGPALQALLARRTQLLGSAYRLFYDPPLHIVSGDGVWLTDADGKRYLDVYNNVPHVGHCHPHVAEAVSRQLQTLNTHTRYLHEAVLDYAEQLVAHFPAGLDTVMFTCTGTEANELALRLAHAATGNTGLIATDFAYHGTSRAMSQITTCYTPPEHRGGHVATIPPPDMYRGPYARDPDPAAAFAAHAHEAIAALARNGRLPAALIVDTAFANEGLCAAPPGYLERTVAAVREAGGLFLADEVQPGFGRLGSHFWGYERHGVTPDIVTLGKPMGNGYPVAAVVTSKAVVDAFSEDAHYFNTYAGTPVAAAAARAVLEVMEKENLQRNALKTGNYLIARLLEMAEDNAMIGDVRGSGLFIGIELVLDRESREPAVAETANTVNLLRERGVLLHSTGVHDNVLKIRPPLAFRKRHADLLLERLDGVLADVSRARPGSR
jgi:4-aminobutyrate aminotransferase-like enzyme